MGLLDKASTRQTPVTGGLLSKIEHAKEPGKPIIAQNSVAVEKQIEKVEVSFSHRVKKKTAGPGKPVTKVDTPGIIKLLGGIADLSPSLEGIAELFELLKQAFTIQKGALLTRTADTDFFSSPRTNRPGHYQQKPSASSLGDTGSATFQWNMACS